MWGIEGLATKETALELEAWSQKHAARTSLSWALQECLDHQLINQAHMVKLKAAMKACMRMHKNAHVHTSICAHAHTLSLPPWHVEVNTTHRMRRWTGFRPSRTSGKARPTITLMAYCRQGPVGRQVVHCTTWDLEFACQTSAEVMTGCLCIKMVGNIPWACNWKKWFKSTDEEAHRYLYVTRGPCSKACLAPVLVTHRQVRLGGLHMELPIFNVFRVGLLGRNS